MPTLSATDAFRHVEDAYRWLAAASCNLETLKAMPREHRLKIDRLLPNVDVALQAAIFQYGRALVEFYTGDGGADTISAAKHFRIRVKKNPHLKALNARFRPGVNVHAAHLTQYRDPAYPDRSKKPRPEWDTEIPEIVKHLVQLLKSVVAQAPPPQCHAAFRALLAATESRLVNRQYDWPTIQP